MPDPTNISPWSVIDFTSASNYQCSDAVICLQVQRILSDTNNWAKAKGVAETRVELGEEAMNSKLPRVLVRSGFGIGGVGLVGCVR